MHYRNNLDFKTLKGRFLEIVILQLTLFYELKFMLYIYKCFMSVSYEALVY